MRFRYAWLILAFALFTPVVHAQRGFGKWEVTPFVGWETSGSFPVANSATVDNFRVDQGVSFGTFVDWSLTDSFQVEGMWNRNISSFDEHNSATGIYTNAYNSNIDQVNFGLAYSFRNPEQKLRPYIAAGLGFTHDSNSGGNPNDTEFSYSVGGGVKYYFSRHFGFRGDLRYMPTYANSSPATFCDPFGNCFVANQRNYISRGNFVAGLIIHF
ncbi:MAG: outer membrane beta-barrel protein [Candidatus Acidiferrales bacterium]